MQSARNQLFIQNQVFRKRRGLKIGYLDGKQLFPVYIHRFKSYPIATMNPNIMAYPPLAFIFRLLEGSKPFRRFYEN